MVYYAIILASFALSVKVIKEIHKRNVRLNKRINKRGKN